MLGAKKNLIIILFFNVNSISSLLSFNSLYIDVDYSNQVKNYKKSIREFKVEQISFDSKENSLSTKTIKRKGLLALRNNAIGTIVFCHGYSHSKHEAFFFKTFFPNFNALAFDFRAHGELVDGQYSTVGADEIYDVKAAVDFVKSRPDLVGKPIIGFGFSMGAVSLLQAQSSWPNLFDMLILDSPFDSGYDCMSCGIDSLMTVKIFGRKYRIPGKNLIMKSLYCQALCPVMKYIFRIVSGFDFNKVPTKFVHVSPIDGAFNIKIPCLFFACVKDANVSVDSVLRLYNAVDSVFKRIWITYGIRHCSAYLTNPEIYLYKMNKFIKKVLEKDMKVKEKVVDERLSLFVT